MRSANGAQACAPERRRSERRCAAAPAVLLADGSPFPGVLGPLAELITIAHGASEAIAAALGRSAAAIAVTDVGSAADILRMLRTSDAGRVDLAIADSGGSGAAQRPGRIGGTGGAARTARTGGPDSETGVAGGGQRLRAVM